MKLLNEKELGNNMLRENRAGAEPLGLQRLSLSICPYFASMLDLFYVSELMICHFDKRSRQAEPN